MAPKIFITGITGYIGGELAVKMFKKHPEYEVTALVRTESQAAIIKETFKGYKVVIGDLDNEDVLLRESSAADIVLQVASSDHPFSVATIIRGMKLGTSKKHAFLIHTSGIGVLSDQNKPGEFLTKVFDDISDIEAITSLPESQYHRNVDMIVLDAANAASAESAATVEANHSHTYRSIKTAIVCPPLIYGTGSGPFRKRSLQIPELALTIMNADRAFTVAGGKNVYRNVHISDLVDAYMLLLEQAAAGGGKATWGAEAYYFAENGEESFNSITHAVAQYAYSKSYISRATVEQLSPKEVTNIYPLGVPFWGGNARGISRRIRALGWKPAEAPCSEFIPEAVEVERSSMLRGN